MCTKQLYGLSEGQDVFLYTLENGKGMAVSITSLGGIVTSLMVPDRDGNTADVVLGYSSMEEYAADSCYFGCLVGRYANRIAGGSFSLDGRNYSLTQNDGPNTLHGGRGGFHKKIWNAKPLQDGRRPGLELTCQSPDGEDGFPGNLKVRVQYTLTEKNELIIDYRAETNCRTVVCLTNHSYFNLSGADTVLDHSLAVQACRYTPVDELYIPTGEIEEVTGTGLDLRKPVVIGEVLESGREFLLEGGLDHNFILDTQPGKLGVAAILSDAVSGRTLEVLTTEPAMQVYTGNYLDGQVSGKLGKRYQKFGGICLEAQHYPDSPNQPDFPSVILEPGEQYRQRTMYRFSISDE